MNNKISKVQKVSSPASKGNRADGFWGFIALTYAMTLVTWGVLAIFQMGVVNTADTSTETSPLAMVLLFLGGFTPSIAGFIMAYRSNGREGLRDLWKRFTQFKLGSRQYLVTIATPLFVGVGTMLVFKLWGGSFVRPEFLDQPAGLISLAIAIFIGGPLSEEFGWRGFAQDRVQKRWGKMKGSLVLGVAWASWHLPLFFIPGSGQQALGNPALMFPVYSIYVTAMTILITLLYNMTNRSLWGAIFFHFMLNFGANMQLAFSEITPRFLYISNAAMIVLLVGVVTYFNRGKEQSGAEQALSADAVQII